MNNDLLALTCINRTDETGDVATFEFKLQSGDNFSYKAGQFLTFAVEIDNQIEYRAYSLSSSPTKPQTAAVTIKRVEGGKVSNFFLDNVYVGVECSALPAAGTFTIEDRKTTKEIIFMSLGSGITPCISMATQLLDSQQDVNIHFIYNAKNADDVIMADKLFGLDEQHSNFRLTRVLKEVDLENSPKTDKKGRMDAFYFETLIPDNRGRTIFICGPTPYMDLVENLAASMGFDMSQFHKESFETTVESNTEKEVDHTHSGDQIPPFTISIPAFSKEVIIDGRTTLLDALEDAGLPIVSACREGFCGACKCKVKGQVDSMGEDVLTKEQLEMGYVLTCCSTASSDLEIDIEPRK
ncbi:MAG TPA: hybrid-cluster NAD(P)-dependent oxidoreductase [Psychromonas hadalis]|nr:hybrid-cluster NAD(P)-dependent oxidoreductase [Psychromonas hadalis]